MTHEQATQLATELNNQLQLNGGSNLVVYVVYPYWDVKGEKYHNVVMIPKNWEAKFATATESQKMGFLRMSIQAQLSKPQTLESYNNLFDNKKSVDNELKDYLN